MVHKKQDSGPPATTIPTIHLLCMDTNFITAFKSAQEKHKLPSSIDITIHNERLNSLPPTLRFDAIVSPANSFARLDGGFDHVLSLAFAPRDDYHALTRFSQAVVWKEWRGFAPPGTCTLVDLDEALKPIGEKTWNCRYMALCPTMKEPMIVNWDREVVYECVWSLLVAVDKHNEDVINGKSGERKIRSLLMTPLATGVGFWSPEQWAAQTVLALKHFSEAVEGGDGIGTQIGKGWGDIQKVCNEVAKTHNRRERGSTAVSTMQSPRFTTSAKLIFLFSLLVVFFGVYIKS